MTTYATKLLNAIETESRKIPLNAKVTKAKQRRMARMVKHLEMCFPTPTPLEIEVHEMEYRIVTVEAWRCDGNWTWNSSSTIGETNDITEDELNNPRKVLKWLRDAGFLDESSKGKVSVDNDGFVVEVQRKGTKEPILAIIRN